MKLGDMLKLLKKHKVAAALFVVGAILIAVGFLTPSRNSDSGGGDLGTYSAVLEEKVREICVSVDGVTEAKVLLTLENGVEYVYAKDSVSETESAYLVIQSGDGETTVKVTEVYPKIRGIAVVCTGGDSAAIKQKLTRLLSAAFDISSARIEIAGFG